MTVHVNIGEAKTRLSELVAAALRGEDIVLDKAGAPQVRLVPVGEAQAAQRAALVKRRLSAIGMSGHLVADPDIAVGKLMTEPEQEESWRRKFGPAD